MCHLPKQQENITNSRWRKREEKKFGYQENDKHVSKPTKKIES